MRTTGELHNLIKASCPHLVGVSIGKEYDHSTWRYQFEGELDAGEEELAAAIAADFDFTSEPPFVYPPLSPRQIRLALLAIGITEDQIDTVLADNPAGMIEWKHSTSFARDHALIGAVAQVFTITEEQINDLWIWASSI